MDTNTKKILICDDSILFRKQIKQSVEVILKDCTIYEATDGTSAVKIFCENKPDLIFMDIIMPLKDGIHALCEILAFNPNANVVMVSSMGTESYVKRAIQFGAKNFLRKPIYPGHIEKIISTLL